MSDTNNTAELQAMLQVGLNLEPEADAGADQFVTDVMSKVQRSARWQRIAALALSALVAVIALPLDTIAINVAQNLSVSVFDIESALAAKLLAPVNTVGSLLSAVLMLMRGFYGWIFRRG